MHFSTLSFRLIFNPFQPSNTTGTVCIIFQNEKKIKMGSNSKKIPIDKNTLYFQRNNPGVGSLKTNIPWLFWRSSAYRHEWL